MACCPCACDRKARDLEIYYRERGFSLQLKIGRLGVLELVGLFRLRTRAFGAKTNCQEVSAGAVFFFLIFLSNMNGQMQSKLDK